MKVRRRTCPPGRTPENHNERNRRVVWQDDGPDSFGRRRFTLLWNDIGGIFRPQPSKVDGAPVGYRRAQCFHAVPSPDILALPAVNE